MKNFLLLISALFLFLTFFVFGIIGTYFLGIFYFWQNRNFIKMFTLPFIIIYQILKSVNYLFYHLALTLDLIGNATAGEVIEKIVTNEKNTLFGEGDVTISASIGKLEYENQLNKRGVFFTNLLSKVFEQNHSILAYQEYLEGKTK